MQVYFYYEIIARLSCIHTRHSRYENLAAQFSLQELVKIISNLINLI